MHLVVNWMFSVTTCKDGVNSSTHYIPVSLLFTTTYHRQNQHKHQQQSCKQEEGLIQEQDFVFVLPHHQHGTLASRIVTSVRTCVRAISTVYCLTSC